MSTSSEFAKALSAQLEDASALCDESLRVVKANESIGVLKAYSRLVGLFLGHSYTNILAPLWAKYPELGPPAMMRPHEEPITGLSPESQVAIAAFVKAAVPAIAQAEQLLSVSMVSKPLPFGGVAEVAHTVSEIEGFLREPRARHLDSPDSNQL